MNIYLNISFEIADIASVNFMYHVIFIAFIALYNNQRNHIWMYLYDDYVFSITVIRKYY